MAREVAPSPCAAAVLRALYPTVAWERVSFQLGIPHAVRPFTRVAITLPHPLSLTRLRVHVAEAYWDPCGIRGLGLLVHEAFHLLQFQQRWRGRGVSVVRGFALQYLAFAAVQGGARGNRYEAPAYAQEEAFLAACEALGEPLCHREGEGCVVSEAALGELLRRWPGLVRREA